MFNPRYQKLLRLAQALDDAGEHEASDIVDSAVTQPERKYSLSKLRQAFEALDFKLTGNAKNERDRPKSDVEILESLYGSREYYLNDGGYSRIILKPQAPDYDRLTAFYTSNSLDRVKNAWDSALPERQAVESAANELYNDEAEQALTRP